LQKSEKVSNFADHENFFCGSPFKGPMKLCDEKKWEKLIYSGLKLSKLSNCMKPISEQLK